MAAIDSLEKEWYLAILSDLLYRGGFEDLFTATGNEVWEQACTPNISNCLLREFGLLLAMDHWNVSDVNVQLSLR